MSGYLRFPNINSITISGRLVRDMDVKHLSNSQTIASMCIAVSHYYRTDSGEFKEQASFVDAVAFGEIAKKCVRDNIKKGSPVILEGYLKTRTYEDKNGQNRKVTEVVAHKIYPLEKSENYENAYAAGHHELQQPSQQSGGYSKPAPQQAPVPNYEPEVIPDYVTTADDVPF